MSNPLNSELRRNNKRNSYLNQKEPKPDQRKCNMCGVAQDAFGHLYSDGNTQTQEILSARETFESERGTYVIEKAIYYGLKTMKAVSELRREDSDIADIEFIRTNLFSKWADELLDWELAEEHFELTKLMGRLETYRSELQEENYFETEGDAKQENTPQ